MNFFINITFITMIILFPVLLYKELNIKNEIIINITIIISYIISIINCRNIYLSIILNLAIIILLLKNNKITYLIISFFTLSYNVNLFLEYLFIFILFFYKKNQINIFIFFSLYFYTIMVLNFEFNPIYYISSIILFLSSIYFISNYYLIDKNKIIEEEYSSYMFKFIHEIKNPLAVVLGYIEIINKKNIDSNRYITTIEKEVRESLNIIEDYLMYGRFNIIFDYVDINLLLKDVYDDFKKLEEVYNMNINYYYDEEEIFICGDYSKLKQVIVNLIKNSIEAKGDKKLEIDIDYKVVKDNIVIDINDNGIGIDNLKLLGNKFYTTKSNGTGLGINFSKKIIDLHKGNICFNSSKNGTNVKINLPIVYI